MQIIVKFKDDVPATEVQKLAAAAYTIPGVIKVSFGTDEEMRREVIGNLMQTLFGMNAMGPFK